MSVHLFQQWTTDIYILVIFQNMSKSETDKTWKTKYTNLTILITEVVGYSFMHIVLNNPGLMIITNVDKHKFNSVITTEMSIQLPW